MALNKRRAGKAEMHLDPTGSPRHELTVAVAKVIIAQLNYFDNSYERFNLQLQLYTSKIRIPTTAVAPEAMKSQCVRISHDDPGALIGPDLLLGEDF
ncbi:MAG: hypothetical protein WBW98_03890 [Candidatus Sulfotelmatobacter sp.]